MIDGALPYLRCPVCGEGLTRACERALSCPRRHSFDLARQGYVNLTAGRSPHSGDTAEMIADRAAFLAQGHYTFIAEALAQTTTKTPAGLVLDAGTGTGHYLAQVMDALPSATGLGLDVSKPALRRAARAHPRAGAALADLWRPLPLADASATVLLNVFAPRNGPEFRRVLHPDGMLLVVTPAQNHLTELVKTYGLIHVDPTKADRVAATLGTNFQAESTKTLRHRMHLTPSQIKTLIGMTPSARHTTEPPQSDPLTVTAEVDLTIYRPA
jgi:23S rRNA (guanine745-N1)-methyltransferase